MKKKPKYKDKCDLCGQYDYLIVFKGKCLCNNCKRKTNNLKYKQLTIFDIMEDKNGE